MISIDIFKLLVPTFEGSTGRAYGVEACFATERLFGNHYR